MRKSLALLTKDDLPILLRSSFNYQMCLYEQLLLFLWHHLQRNNTVNIAQIFKEGHQFHIRICFFMGQVIQFVDIRLNILKEMILPEELGEFVRTLTRKLKSRLKVLTRATLVSGLTK